MESLFAPFLFLAVPAGAMAPELPPVPVMQLEHPVSRRPAETRLPAAKLRDQHRRTSSLLTIGATPYRASVQYGRFDEWHLILLQDGKSPFEPAAVVPLHTVTKERAIPLGGKDYLFSYDPAAGVVTIREMDGSNARQASLENLKQAVFDSATQVPCLGSEWRFLFQSDVWQAAGMFSFVFLEKTGSGIAFHRVRGERIDDTREVPADLGSRAVGLSFSGLELVIRPIP